MITEKEYLRRKPDAKIFYTSDKYYLDLANTLDRVWADSGLFNHIPEQGRKEVVLNLIGYMLDIVADMGLWRAFTTECMNLYGRPVPFYTPAENHINLELNRCDVEFMIWYSMTFLTSESAQPIYPQSDELKSLSTLLYDTMEKAYDDAPAPEGLVVTKSLDIYDTEDVDEIARLGHWLFWSSYLLVPSFMSNLAVIMQQGTEGNRDKLLNAMHEAQASVPTGPLALFLREWVWLILQGKMPTERRNTVKDDDETDQHPYYAPFLRANNGNVLAFFDDYKEMNRFLGKALGWDPEADNLPQLKNNHDFVLMVNPDKGMLIARDVARCIAAPGNKLYDPEYAAAHSFELLTVKGRCPVDLTLYCLDNELLPDLHWPGVEGSHHFTAQNADFIARCFLLQYYRAD